MRTDRQKDRQTHEEANNLFSLFLRKSLKMEACCDVRVQSLIQWQLTYEVTFGWLDLRVY